MTVQEFKRHLLDGGIPNDAKIMSNSGWECSETEIGGIWYCAESNEIHLTQGGPFERKHGYKSNFRMIYCTNEILL